MQRSRTLAAMKYIFDNYRNDVIVNPQTGTIYKFYADAATIQKGDSTKIRWDVEPGSMVTLDGEIVDVLDSLVVSPKTTATYTLKAAGQITDSVSITITVLPTGQIITFKAMPPEIGTGESTNLIWNVVKGSSVTLNGNPVKVQDTLKVFPDSLHNTYALVAEGDLKDSIQITVPVLKPDLVDRALDAAVKVASNDTAEYKYSKPRNIVDGNYFTRWQAVSGNGQWVQIDLGKQIDVSKIIIHWGGSQAYASKYNIQISKDSSSWSVLQAVFNGTGGTNNVETLDNLNGTGRYLTFLLQTMAVNPISIAEIEVYGIPSSIQAVDKKHIAPVTYNLSQNYPNPFNPSTQIGYSIAEASKVQLTVYNLLGQKIATLVNEQRSAGTYSVKFDASQYSSGIYFYTLRAGEFVKTKKMILLK